MVSQVHLDFTSHLYLLSFLVSVVTSSGASGFYLSSTKFFFPFFWKVNEIKSGYNVVCTMVLS
jgi:hypothetical protein